MAVADAKIMIFLLTYFIRFCTCYNLAWRALCEQNFTFIVSQEAEKWVSQSVHERVNFGHCVFMEFVVPRYIVIMLLLIIIDLLDIFPRSFNSLDHPTAIPKHKWA